MSVEVVLDANVLIQDYLAEGNTPHTQALLAQLADADPCKLHLPEFCIVECANILWRHVPFHGMALDTATRSVETMRSLPLTLHPVLGLLPRALAIGSARQLAVYDSVYIALAEMLKLPLVTDDRKQAMVAQAVGVSLKPISDFRPA
jgi:predicted nucleic acid-binding protein